MWSKENQINIPCGRCPVCVKRRISGWSIRLQKEAGVSTSAYFVTLTYGTDNVPITKNGWLTLQKTHLQDFFKRLRYYEQKQGIKYYAVGEYGTKKKRPHYHIILFNAERENIAKAWTFGEIHIGQVTPASTGYTLKYISKEKQTTVPNDDRQKIFSIMSKGLGKAYTEDKKNIKWHTDSLEDRYYIPAGGGTKASMPRYYREKIYNSEQFGYLKGVLEKDAKEKEDEYNKKYSSWHKAQHDINEFKKMKINSTKNETL